VIGEVYRAPNRDRYGDPVDDDGNPVDMLDPSGLCHIGRIDSLVMGGQSWSRVQTRGEVADTTGMIGCPVAGFLPLELPFTLGELKLTHGDRIDIDGVRYSVVGPRLWDYENSLTGTNFGRYWVHVTAATN
jgi:hypothetical protein